jgi:aconitate hydratase
MNIKAVIHREDKSQTEINLLCRINTANEVEYYRHGGILQFVLRSMLKK